MTIIFFFFFFFFPLISCLFDEFSTTRVTRFRQEIRYFLPLCSYIEWRDIFFYRRTKFFALVFSRIGVSTLAGAAFIPLELWLQFFREKAEKRKRGQSYDYSDVRFIYHLAVFSTEELLTSYFFDCSLLSHTLVIAFIRLFLVARFSLLRAAKLRK